MNSGDQHKRQEEWVNGLRKVLREMPDDYCLAGDIAEQLRHLFHAELAEAIQPRLNAHLKQMPQSTLPERQALATWLHGQLHDRLGLAVRCPRTSHPALLITDRVYADKDYLRWRLHVTDPAGGSTKTYLSSKLPELDLMENPPRKETFSKGSRRERGR